MTPRRLARQHTRSHSEHSIASMHVGSRTSSRNVRSFEMLPTAQPAGSCS
ncbi:MAG TPA: hypothetical protein VKE22_25565 [Haliangiales bacterium]|nr:hypothetical protein [Haliangiales bacterium]